MPASMLGFLVLLSKRLLFFYRHSTRKGTPSKWKSVNRVHPFVSRTQADWIHAPLGLVTTELFFNTRFSQFLRLDSRRNSNDWPTDERQRMNSVVTRWFKNNKRRGNTSRGRRRTSSRTNSTHSIDDDRKSPQTATMIILQRSGNERQRLQRTVTREESSILSRA